MPPAQRGRAAAAGRRLLPSMCVRKGKSLEGPMQMPQQMRLPESAWLQAAELSARASQSSALRKCSAAAPRRAAGEPAG